VPPRAGAPPLTAWGAGAAAALSGTLPPPPAPAVAPRVPLTPHPAPRRPARRSLEDLPASLRPHMIPLPGEGTGRMARASHAHAMALAEITPLWWRPLGRFRGTDLSLDQDRVLMERLEARDAARRARWAREREEQDLMPTAEDLARGAARDAARV